MLSLSSSESHLNGSSVVHCCLFKNQFQSMQIPENEKKFYQNWRNSTIENKVHTCVLDFVINEPNLGVKYLSIDIQAVKKVVQMHRRFISDNGTAILNEYRLSSQHLIEACEQDLQIKYPAGAAIRYFDYHFACVL